MSALLEKENDSAGPNVKPHDQLNGLKGHQTIAKMKISKMDHRPLLKRNLPIWRGYILQYRYIASYAGCA